MALKKFIENYKEEMIKWSKEDPIGYYNIMIRPKLWTIY
jgi:hypothetical protein